MISELTIPVMDQTTETVALTGWLKREGDWVQAGEAVCEIETDKATVEITAAAGGRLRKILIPAGTQVPPRTVVGLIGPADEPLPDIDPYYRTAKPTASGGPTAAAPETPAPAERDAAAARKVIISPRARRLAEQHGVDLASLQGTGPGGRILEEDVQQALSSVPAAAPVPAPDRAARAKAERVVRSWQTIPHFFTVITVDLTSVAAARAAGPAEVTFTDYFALALAHTLPSHPHLNGFWDAQRDALEIVPAIRLGLVVETEQGLVIPALPDLRGRSLPQITTERARVVAQARAGKLPADALGMPTFSLTNVGSGHIDQFTALISPPQVAMLAAASVQPRALVIEGQVEPRTSVTFTLCADHRAVDGRQAARFLEQLKSALEA
jgi:pyruvate dehydrogenase E2 component (dihydrolipoamide acetyltransferase)